MLGQDAGAADANATERLGNDFIVRRVEVIGFAGGLGAGENGCLLWVDDA